MARAWQIASINFREDDDSLPAVEFAQPAPESAGELYRFVSENGRCTSDSPTVWDNQQQADVPLMSASNTCGWLHAGRTGPFHHCFGDIAIDGDVIPEIGVFDFKDAVEIGIARRLPWPRR